MPRSKKPRSPPLAAERVLRLGLGQLGEAGRIGAHFLQQGLGLGLDLGLLLRLGVLGHGQQDVGRAALLIAELGLVLFVVFLQLGVAGLDTLRQRVLGQQHVVQLHLLRQAEALGVGVVVCLERGVVGLDLSGEVRRLQQQRAHFAALAQQAGQAADHGIRDEFGAGDAGQLALQHDVALDLGFEGLGRRIAVLQEFAVARRAEFTVVLEGGDGGDDFAQLLGADGDATVMRVGQQQLLANQVFQRGLAAGGIGGLAFQCPIQIALVNLGGTHLGEIRVVGSCFITAHAEAHEGQRDSSQDNLNEDFIVLDKLEHGDWLEPPLSKR